MERREPLTITVPLRSRKATNPLSERLRQEIAGIVDDPHTAVFPAPDWQVVRIKTGEFRGFGHEGIRACRQYVREGVAKTMRVLASPDGTMLLIPDAPKEEVDETQDRLSIMSMEDGGVQLTAERPYDGHVVAVAIEYGDDGSFRQAIARHKNKHTGEPDTMASSLLFVVGQNIPARFAGIGATLCSEGTNSKVDWVLRDTEGRELVALRGTPGVLPAKSAVRYILETRNAVLAAAKTEEDTTRSMCDEL